MNEQEPTEDLAPAPSSPAGPPAPTGEEAASYAKFDARPPTQPVTPEPLPWSYGRDEIRALPVDPRRLFVYWEVTDPAIDRACRRLDGETLPGLVLRIYETTGRIFDGTNAHTSVDLEVTREERQRFLVLDRPGSSHCIEIGVRSGRGDFQRIARSRRVDLPLREPLPGEETQWVTVAAATGSHRLGVRSFDVGSFDVRSAEPAERAAAGIPPDSEGGPPLRGFAPDGERTATADRAAGGSDGDDQGPTGGPSEPTTPGGSERVQLPSSPR